MERLRYCVSFLIGGSGVRRRGTHRRSAASSGVADVGRFVMLLASLGGCALASRWSRK